MQQMPGLVPAGAILCQGIGKGSVFSPSAITGEALSWVRGERCLKSAPYQSPQLQRQDSEGHVLVISVNSSNGELPQGGAMSSPALICMFMLSLLHQSSTHQAWGFYHNHRIREYPELEGTHKVHWFQLLESCWGEPAHAADQVWCGTRVVSDKHQCHPEKRLEKMFGCCCQEVLSHGSTLILKSCIPFPDCTEARVKAGKVSKGCHENTASQHGKLWLTPKKMQSLSWGMYPSSVSEQYQHTLHQATPQACSAISWVYS